MAIKAGATSQSILVLITTTAGAAITGLVYNSSGLVAYYARPGAAAVAITLATQTAAGAWSSGGFAEISSTNCPGLYRLDVPNAVIAAGVPHAAVYLSGYSGMAPCVAKIDLVAYDPQDAGDLGLTNLDATVSSRLASASYTAPLDAAGTRSAVGLASANLDTQLSTIDDFLDTEVAAIKAKTDNLPSDPADASVIAGRFDTLDTAIAALPTSTDPYAVLGLRTVIAETENDFITAYDGDDRTVALYFVDGAGNPAAIPTGATAAMLDATGATVGTSTVSDSKTAVGYLSIRLQVPSSGNRPTSLQVTFSGGSGAAYKHRVPMVVTA